jgi:chromosome segregation ATPase
VVTAAHEKHVMGARAREQTSESELAALAAQAADLSQKQDALLAQSAAALEGTVARAKEHLKSEMAARARAEARLAAAAADAGALRAREAELLSVLAAAEADARDARAAAAALESAEAMHAARVRAVEEAHRALVHVRFHPDTMSSDARMDDCSLSCS